MGKTVIALVPYEHTKLCLTFSQGQGMGVSTSNLNYRYGQWDRHLAAWWWTTIRKNVAKSFEQLSDNCAYYSCVTEWVITLVCDCWEVLVTLAVHPLLPPRRKRVQMHSQPESGPDRKPSPPHGPAPPLELRKNDRNCTQTCQLDHITCLTTVASA